MPAALAEVWPDAAARKPGAALAPGTVVLNVVGEGSLHALLAAPARAPFALEVPAFLLADSALHAPLRAWHEAGGELWIKGRGATEIDADLRSCFRHLLYELPDAPPPGRGSWLAVAAGATSIAELDAAVRQGLVMEELARAAGDAEMKSEMFICGVVSLLDSMLGQPMAELLPNVPLPERVRQALGAQ